MLATFKVCSRTPLPGFKRSLNRKVTERKQRRGFSIGSSVPRKIKSILACKRGHESEVIDDIRLASENRSIHCSSHPGWVEVTSADPIVESSWALQILPDIRTVSARSQSNLALEASRIVISSLKPLLSKNSSAAPIQWQLHTLPSHGTSWQSKVKPLEARLSSLLSSSPIGKYRVSGNRRDLKPCDILVQCFLKTEDTLVISITPVSKKRYFWLKPVPWHCGIAPISTEGDYPAESFKKCKEILRHMNIAAKGGLEGKAVVELGANPGGWTLVLLEAGARVTSVDWADLEDPRFKAHPMLTHMCQDARTFNPVEAGIFQAGVWNSSSNSSTDPSQSRSVMALDLDGARATEQSDAISQPLAALSSPNASPPRNHVDFLFTDLALPPEKSLLAFNNWIEQRWTQAFAWTFKFGFHPPTEKYAPMIQKIRKTMQSYGGDLEFSIRHLSKHENEIVVLGGWKTPL